jgi:hypothetical protein
MRLYYRTIINKKELGKSIPECPKTGPNKSIAPIKIKKYNMAVTPNELIYHERAN